MASFINKLSLIRGSAPVHFAIIELGPIIGLFASIQNLAQQALESVYGDAANSPLLNGVTGPAYMACLRSYAQSRYLSGATTLPQGCSWRIGPSPGTDAATASEAFGGPADVAGFQTVLPFVLFIFACLTAGVFYTYMLVKVLTNKGKGGKGGTKGLLFMALGDGRYCEAVEYINQSHFFKCARLVTVVVLSVQVFLVLGACLHYGRGFFAMVVPMVLFLVSVFGLRLTAPTALKLTDEAFLKLKFKRAPFERNGAFCYELERDVFTGNTKNLDLLLGKEDVKQLLALHGVTPPPAEAADGAAPVGASSAKVAVAAEELEKAKMFAGRIEEKKQGGGDV